MFEKNKLIAAMMEVGLNVTATAEKMGISRSSFYRKMKKDGDFSRRELLELSDLIGREKVSRIFFEDMVS